MKRVPLYMRLILIASLALTVIAAVQPEEFGSLEELLVWIVGGGGAMILAGYVVAYFLENLAFWHDLPRTVKVLVPLALAGVFGFAAQSVLALELLPLMPPIVQSVLLMLINWLFSQRAYAGIKSGSYAAGARK